MGYRILTPIKARLSFLLAAILLIAPGFAHAQSPSLEGNGGWIGPRGPLPPPDLTGKVVLYDFWDYTCINCIRTFPHLNALYEKYRNRGLVIVAIHAPEFSFAAQPKRVEKAIRLYGLRFPVVMDKDQKLWNRFHNHYWPADYLYDRNGQLVYHSFGEGGYDLLEGQVRLALHLSSRNGRPDDADFPETLTPELYAGTERGHLGNPSGYHPEGSALYAGDSPPPSLITLHGPWRTEADRIVSRVPQSGHSSSLTVIYQGTGVNAVLKRATGKTALPVLVIVDGRPVPERYFGRDIRPLSSRQTGILLKEARMYSLVSGEPYGEHRLDLVFPDRGEALYTLTFNP